MFNSEAEFEAALIKKLTDECGWDKKILRNYSEKDLIKNWADILFQNNRQIDRLNDYPLTEGEMGQILEQIKSLRTPVKLNGFINGGSILIKRDNEDDKAHFGKEISLKIYDRKEIAAGKSRYQIVEQPQFPVHSDIKSQRRGDLLLLINGMPVIHIELKNTNVPVSQACYQIQKYAGEGIYTGIYSLVQIFVAMNPEETRYFANPGPEGKFNPDFYFHWADFNNNPINDWKRIATSFLSIPMAHQLIGFYTVADDTDGVLKVMRSYQYYAANAISDRVSKTKWDEPRQRGGYVWHTTGSGKTLTSFKSAQLIAASRDADKVIFLMDRIELGTQSLREYQGFAADDESIQATENTTDLLHKLRSDSANDTLIVTSIQKMSRISKDARGGAMSDAIDHINTKRMVFIIDECHRSTFGEMMLTIRQTFPRAIFFGFTGTPIQEENQKKQNTTTSIFGDELHRYSIADGIRDKNVLGFDPYMVLTYKESDLRQAVAEEKAHVRHEDVKNMTDVQKEKYYAFMQLPMAGTKDPISGKFEKGIEDYLPADQYRRQAHQMMVVQDIREHWPILSHNSKFHALFATSSINEAIEYYRLMKKELPELKITALFDSNIDNNAGANYKEDGLEEIVRDYNERYHQDFTIPTFSLMKKDIAARLAHKQPYTRIDLDKKEQLDLLIVVDQMLTGFDSKWINTLYLDKLLEYERVIQAFSRTNRLFGPDKPFGTIRYYRYPNTQRKNVEDAVKLYSGDRPFGLFVDKLKDNLRNLNNTYQDIQQLFINADIPDFSHLPDEIPVKQKFAKLFKQMNEYIEAAELQGFTWDKRSYLIEPEAGDEAEGDTGEETVIDVQLDERDFKTMAQRYKELAPTKEETEAAGSDLPYEIDGYLTTIDTEMIDSEYMNSRFEKWIKELNLSGPNAEITKRAEAELHSSFASLTQDEQKYANIFLHDIQRGDVKVEPGKSLRDYITEYMARADSDRIHRFSETFGLDEEKLRGLKEMTLTEGNINEYGRFDALKETVDKGKAKAYFEKHEGRRLPPPKVTIKIDSALRDFILDDKCDPDIEEPEE
ncbi:MULTISPECIES: type I restriction endonuclease subunit R [Sutterellaceae]|nr:HsdR family type I site-specific deoxyribonuclease [Mesosutterella multiformis]GCB31118.1 DEAD/DEAH box helicase [Mesosutterella multiformis]